jgi:hypothetical protein
MADNAQISARLKAARWLNGGLDEKGKPKALSVGDLSQRRPLKENDLSQNRIEEIEQLKAEARPMEVDQLAIALGVPAAWFTAEDWRSLISAGAAADASPEVAQLRAERSELLTTISRVRTELEGLRRQQPPAENG